MKGRRMMRPRQTIQIVRKSQPRSEEPEQEIDGLILALKAGGGYKYRSMLRLQEGQEFNKQVAIAEIRLRYMAAALQLAETMLREPPPGMWHPRWDEYKKRLIPILTRLHAVAKARGGPMDSLGNLAARGPSEHDAIVEPPMSPAANTSQFREEAARPAMTGPSNREKT